MGEAAICLQQEGMAIYACLHRTPLPARGLIVLCHPLAEERKCAARTFVDLAGALADDGWHALRFDYRGCGDSQGDFEDFTPDDWLQDIGAALDFGRQIVGPDLPVGLMGLRAGASLAARAAAGRKVQPLLLWEPISGRAYLEEIRRRRLLRGAMSGGRQPGGSAAEGFDNEGFLFTAELCRQLAELDPWLLPQSAGTLLLRISPGRDDPAQDYANADLLRVPGPPLWQRVGVSDASPQISATLAWLERKGGETKAPLPAAEVLQTGVPLSDSEEAVLFAGPENAALHGILHMPSQPPSAGALLLHGWGGCRIGEHRSFVKLARLLADQGVAVLRFDFRGRGESGGDAAAASLTGMAEDGLLAAAYLKARAGVEDIFLVGSCSGAETGLLISQQGQFSGLAGWSLPAPAGVAVLPRRLSRFRSMAGEYLRKLGRAETWKKLLRGRVRAGAVAGVLLGGARAGPASGGSLPARMLLIYGGADPEAAAAEDYYRRSTTAGTSLQVRVIAGANHGFYAAEWERDLLALTAGWIGGRDA